jgi:transaldolase
MGNPLMELESFGQSIWMDFLRRSAIDSGELKQLIDQDGVSGVTSNPSIFEKAIAGSRDYDEAVQILARQGKSVEEIYEALTVEDIQRTADLFRPVYDRLDGRDGFVSLEVSPTLAGDTAGSIQEAHRLWKKVGRPNLMIKIPATEAGLPAIRQLIGEGINVNITLLFGLPSYRQVVDAYLAGLEALAAQGKPLDRSASVASFFLSRIDTLADPILKKIRLDGGPRAELVAGLYGELAIASAKVAYQIYQEIFAQDRFKKLAQKGARTQRLLWASTSTKNPEFSDVKYVEPLIGRDTINTLPLETIHLYRDHGSPALSLEDNVEQAYQKLDQLGLAGLDLNFLTKQLEEEGVEKFEKAFETLMTVLGEKREAAMKKTVER